MRSAQENANLGQSRGERKIRNWREVLKKMQTLARAVENIKLEIDVENAWKRGESMRSAKITI